MFNSMAIPDITLSRIMTTDLTEVVDLYRTYRPGGPKGDRLKNEIRSHPSVKACCGSKLIGFAYCYSFAPDILELANIFVDQRFRGAGIGEQLLRAICEEATKSYRGVIAVNSLLHRTTEPKSRPDSLYLRCGFEVIFQTDQSTIFARSL